VHLAPRAHPLSNGPCNRQSVSVRSCYLLHGSFPPLNYRVCDLYLNTCKCMCMCVCVCILCIDACTSKYVPSMPLSARMQCVRMRVYIRACTHIHTHKQTREKACAKMQTRDERSEYTQEGGWPLDWHVFRGKKSRHSGTRHTFFLLLRACRHRPSRGDDGRHTADYRLLLLLVDVRVIKVRNRGQSFAPWLRLRLQCSTWTNV
jgi:hypothetical protein